MSKWLEEELAGKTIIGVRVKCPAVWLEVKGGGWVELSVEGDCCSDASLDAVRLDGNPTLTGEDTQMEFSAKPTTQECDKITAVTLHCDRGGVSILHRNSSNGYYSNYLSARSRGEPPADAADVKDWYKGME